MARRGGGAAITLFSFQDIITSVSGIMIFVTLLLALELTEKTSGAGASPATRDASDLTARIEAARAELDDLRRRALAEGRPSGRSSLADERAAREAEDRVEDSERELAALERRAEGAGDREDEAEARHSGSDLRRQELRKKLAELDTLRRRLEAADDGDRVYFNVEVLPSARRSGWLALLHGRGVAVAPLGRPQRPLLFSAPPPMDRSEGLDPASRAFLSWASREVRDDYLLLVVRPSGLERADMIQDELAQRRHPYGIDLVTDSQDVLDPEHGVYRP